MKKARQTSNSARIDIATTKKRKIFRLTCDYYTNALQEKLINCLINCNFFYI